MPRPLTRSRWGTGPGSVCLSACATSRRVPIPRRCGPPPTEAAHASLSHHGFDVRDSEEGDQVEAFDDNTRTSTRTFDRSTALKSLSPAVAPGRRYEMSRSATTGAAPPRGDNAKYLLGGRSPVAMGVPPTPLLASPPRALEAPGALASSPYGPPPELKRSVTTGHSPPKARSTGIRWRKGNTIGQGAFGAVHLGMNDDTGAIMAVKELRFSYDDKREIQNLQSEINLMRCVRGAGVCVCGCSSVPAVMVSRPLSLPPPAVGPSSALHSRCTCVCMGKGDGGAGRGVPRAECVCVRCASVASLPRCRLASPRVGTAGVWRTA